MGFESFLAHRYLARRKKNTLICVMSLAIGILALIVVRAVFSGFQAELKQTMVSVHPHIKIEKNGGMDNAVQDIEKVKALHLPGLVNVSRFVVSESMIKSEYAATGLVIRGMDLQYEDTSVYRKKIIAGDFEFSGTVQKKTRRKTIFFKQTIEENVPGIILGDELAQVLHVGVGDKVTVISPSFEIGVNPLSLSQVLAKPFIVRGIFHMGMSEFDGTYALMELSESQKMFRLGSRVGGLSLRFQDVDEALKWKIPLRSEFGIDYLVRSWHDVNPTFFQAVKVEKSVQTIFLGLIVLVAVFNIFSTLIMIVMEKTKDIGILRAIGAKAGAVRKIFLIQGLTIGFYGVIFGVSGGLLILHYRNQILQFIKDTTGFELFPSDVYLFDGLPAQTHISDIVVIAIFGVLAALFAAFYPAYRAAKLHPVEALRYE